MRLVNTNTAPAGYSAGFDESEIEFTRQLVLTGSESEAMAISGINIPKMNALLKSSNFEALLRAQAGHVFIRVLIPTALARLKEYIEKGAKPDRGQLDAVKTVLDRAGMIAPKASDPVDYNRELEEMTTEQLHKVITDGNAIIAGRFAPNATVQDSEVIEVLS